MDDPQNSFGGDTLSQSEVERLLAQVSEPAPAAPPAPLQREVKKEAQGDPLQRHDFRHAVCLPAGDLRKLRLEHEEYIRELAARLSSYLRLEFALQMTRLQTVPYSQFIDSIANPALLTMFKVEPKRGVCILEINSRLGLTIIDRLMGGPGHSVNVNRGLSDIELALLDQAVEVILNEWCAHWSRLEDLHPVLLGHENNGRFLQTSQPDTMMLVLGMEARLGDCMEQVQMGFPYATIEPLVRKLGLKMKAEATEAAHLSKGPLWHRDLEKVQIRVTAQSPQIPFKARDLVHLKIGDTLPLESDFFNHIQVRLAKMAKFAGVLGSQNRNRAIQITEILKT